MWRPLLAVMALFLLGGCGRPAPNSATPTPAEQKPFANFSLIFWTIGQPGQATTRKKVEALALCFEQAGATASLTMPAAVTPLDFNFKLAPQLPTGSKDVLLYSGSGDTPGTPETLPRSEVVYRMSSPWRAAPSINPFEVVDGATATGEYLVSLSAFGRSKLTIGPGQDFLPGLVVTEPTTAVVEIQGAPLKLSWQPLTGVVGYAVRAVGSNAAGDSAFWEHPLAHDQAVHRSGPLAALKARKLLGPDELTCTLPAGFLKEGIVSVHAFSESATGVGDLQSRGWAESAVYIDLK